jgi:hypothetical protein
LTPTPIVAHCASALQLAFPISACTLAVELAGAEDGSLAQAAASASVATADAARRLARKVWGVRMQRWSDDRGGSSSQDPAVSFAA